MLLAVGLEPRSLRPRLLLVGLEGLFHQGAHAGHPVRASVAVPVVVDPLQQFVRQSDRQRGAFVVAHGSSSDGSSALTRRSSLAWRECMARTSVVSDVTPASARVVIASRTVMSSRNEAISSRMRFCWRARNSIVTGCWSLMRPRA